MLIIQGAKDVEKIEKFFEDNNILTLQDVEKMKENGLLVYKFWIETKVDIEALTITDGEEEEEYGPGIEFTEELYELEYRKTHPDLENAIGFIVIKVVMSIFIIIGLLSYLVIMLGSSYIKIL